MSSVAGARPKIEGHSWLRIDLQEGGRYLGIP